MDRYRAERSIRLGVLLGIWVVIVFVLTSGVAAIATG